MKLNLKMLAFILFPVLLVICASCTSSQLYMMKGKNMERAGNFTGAVTNYTQAIESRGLWDEDWPALDELRVNIARDKYQLGDYAGAVAEYDEYIRQHPGFDKGFFKSGAVEIYLERGNAKYAAKDLAGTIADCSQAIQLQPKNAEAYYQRACARWKLKDFTGAAADFDAGLTNHYVINASTYIKRARFKYSLEDYVGAGDDYSKAVEFDPKNVDAYYLHGFVCWALKNYAEALTNFTKAIELHPEYVNPYLFSGNVKFDLRDYPAAITDFSKAIQLNPKNLDLYECRGRAQFRLLNYKQALADYDKIIALSPTNAIAYGYRAKALIGLDDNARAITNLNQAVKLSPGSARIYVECGWDWNEIGDFKSALTNFDQAIQLGSTNSSAYIGLGCSQSDLFQLRPALGSFQKVEQLDPSWVYAWYHIYLLRVQLGESEAAEIELTSHMKSLTGAKTNDWSARVGDYLVGTLSEKDFFKTAKASALNLVVQKEQLCEADYYAGMWHLLAGKKKEALILFQACVDTEEKDFMEYTSAKAELEAMKN